MSATMNPNAPELVDGTNETNVWSQRFARLSPAQRIFAISMTSVLVLSIVRLITGADDLTSSGTMAATLRVTSPILLAGLAGLWAERAGVVNIGIEGMMVVGTWLGGFGGWKWGAWAGIALGIAGGALFGLIHAVAVVRFNVDHVVSGIAINILAAGSTEYLSTIVFAGQQGGGESQSPAGKGGYGSFDMPFLAGGKVFGWKSPDVLGRVEGWSNVPLLPDLAGILRGVMSDIDFPTMLALSLVPLTAFVLWKTRFGLRVRSSGEAPGAGESLGVNIVRLRYQALAISGALAGFGGAYLSTVATSTYRQGQVAGQGFVGLATTIFGNWRPTGVLGGATLFGFAQALRYRDSANVPALFLFTAIIMGLLLIISLMRGMLVTATVALMATALFFVAYVTIKEIPDGWLAATPYIVTLLVLATASQSLRPPAHAGIPWRRGDNH
jgi:general nucleoside transport system permease protein